MKMYIIGTGTATVTKYVNTSCVFEEDDQLFLVDGTGGCDIMRSFEALHLDWRKLHHAFLSHEHTDHFLGMVWVVRMIAEYLELDDYEGDLYIYGHKEVLEKIRAVCSMVLKARSLAFIDKRIFFLPVADHEKRIIWDHTFTFFDIGSKKAKQYGFLMEYGDAEPGCLESDRMKSERKNFDKTKYHPRKKLVFAGDEPLKENGKQFCKHADWLLSEAFCLFDEEPQYHAYQYSHQTVKEAAMIAEEEKVKNLLIWHTEDGTFGKRKELYTQEAAQYYHGNIFVPDDGEIIEL